MQRTMKEATERTAEARERRYTADTSELAATTKAITVPKSSGQEMPTPSGTTEDFNMTAPLPDVAPLCTISAANSNLSSSWFPR